MIPIRHKGTAAKTHRNEAGEVIMTRPRRGHRRTIERPAMGFCAAPSKAEQDAGMPIQDMYLRMRSEMKYVL